MKKFDSILVANRGEIAVRIMRTARALGYRSIAVYSEADAGAPHVQMADDAFLLGPSPALQSYLNVERILTAAAATGAQAIHPGYGFLSENAAFARAVETAGLVFIGPSPESVELMGNKAAAKRRMLEANVPCVPGYEGMDQSDAALTAAAKRIGYPLMVKAAAGGGGRGMRLVHTHEALLDGLTAARSEAKNAFGSDELILERAIVRPRHVEIQVFADTQGNTVYLGERDCSVQRRHQKVVEEAPCPIMTPELRTRMGSTAVEAARSIGYRGAGTIEFLLDERGEFYFLEMNTRLQVEHPVTELTTGLDLVALQIAVAEGHALPFTQDDVKLSGHAIEVRLYAEDPAQGFLPVSGKIRHWQPAGGEGVRIDAGIRAGQEISPFYDAMLAKVIAWGEDRDTAVARLIAALDGTQLFGLVTNKSFLVDILKRETFQRGLATTAFIAEEFPGPIQRPLITSTDAAIASTLQFIGDRSSAQGGSLGVRDELLNWSSRGLMQAYLRYRDAHSLFDVVLNVAAQDRYRIKVNDAEFDVEVIAYGAQSATLSIDGRRSTLSYQLEPPGLLHVAIGGRTLAMRNELAYPYVKDERANGGRVTAVMHGVLLKVFVKTGDRVGKGTPLAILEAMKMQHELRSEVEGEVAAVTAATGSQVAADDLLIEISVDGI
jgi:geranyl-CoA carboxylase alpha subunit